jgi:LemA protein
MTVLIIALLTVLAVVYWWYASLIARRNKVLEALSSVDVQMRKRHDLLPNLLKLADRFMTHERNLLSTLTRLREDSEKPYNPAKPREVECHLAAEAALQSGMAQILARAEAYPDLRSSEAVVEAQRSFHDVEDHIAAARRSYNAAVTRLNDFVQIFPGNAIATSIGISSMPFFQMEESVRQAMDVDAYLGTGGST